MTATTITPTVSYSANLKGIPKGKRKVTTQRINLGYVALADAVDAPHIAAAIELYGAYAGRVHSLTVWRTVGTMTHYVDAQGTCDMFKADLYGATSVIHAIGAD